MLLCTKSVDMNEVLMAAEVNDRVNVSNSPQLSRSVEGASGKSGVYATPVVKHLGNVRTLTLGGSVDFVGDGNKKPGP